MNMHYNLEKFNIQLDIKRIANVHYFEFTSNYHAIKNKHNFNELVYVDNGYIDIIAENFQGRLNQNQLIIHKANEPHSLSSDIKTAPNVIIIGFECQCPELDVFSKKPITLGLSEQAILSEIIKESRNVFLPPYDIPYFMKKRDAFPFGADQLIKNLLEYLLVKFVRAEKALSNNDNTHVDNAPTLIKEVQAYIFNNYDQNFKLNELCFIFGTNKTTLCSLFKKHLNCTIIDYVNKLKLRMAKIKMREGRENFTQISESLGFSSVHYFSKIFKQHEKLTPSQYVKTIKSKL